ncbi:MAG: hypothetical protein D6695_05675, partial [Planctomycetota bacterium]
IAASAPKASQAELGQKRTIALVAKGDRTEEEEGRSRHVPSIRKPTRRDGPAANLMLQHLIT